MIALGGLCAEAQLNVAQTLPIRELSEGHHAKLLGAGEVFDVVIAVATGNDSMKALPREESISCANRSLPRYMSHSNRKAPACTLG